MKGLFGTSIMMCKGSDDYFITNVNYIEMSKEDYFSIINNDRFLFKRMNNIETLNSQKLRILDIANLGSDSFEQIEWLSQPQVNTLKGFVEDNPRVSEDGYYLLNLEIMKEETKEVLKRLSFSSDIGDHSVVSNIYSNILNIQTNDYFEYLDRLILVTDNLHVNENDLVDYVNDKIELNVEFRTITKTVSSSMDEEGGYELNRPSTIFVLMVEKVGRDGSVIY